MAERYLTVHVTPRAKREAVTVEGSLIHVSVPAPAERGAANTAVLALLSASLGLPQTDLRIVTGRAGRRKLIAIEGLDAAGALARLRERLLEKG